MNGKNGNILEGYYSNRNNPNWSLVLSLCTLILAVLGVVYYTLAKQVDLQLKISELKNENTNLKFRNEMQKQILENRFAPDKPFVQEE